MKIVLPIYRERISPVFDWSMKVLLVEIKSDDELKKKEIDISLLSDIERIY
ncbi:MAG: hypothetical protein GY863_00565, partial [bacterium]|nr:hypothetical protein [bacterium]